MSDSAKKVLGGILSLIFFGLIVYGALTNFFIPSNHSMQVKVFDVDFVKDYPNLFTSVDHEASILEGTQNGISIGGKMIWAWLNESGHDYYSNFPDNFLLKIVWLIIGIPIEVVLNFFLFFLISLIIIYKLAALGGLVYKISLIISFLIPFGLRLIISKLKPYDV
ncbi:hypothetical protein A3844_08395 [Paenibacillus helianthi]|uniref:DUF4306 domain-containing protein n=1 Tax=Paenibacillus helianthi TaxID=1349432 RepID=A0ABX3EU98_9BACL|nr:hypothetical protein [Paenibacillus helianthi]OKP88378.1 hypothetical protein A3844_08395 [Paenibacillus helianthi]